MVVRGVVIMLDITEMKKRNEFFSKHRYKNIGKIRQKFLKVKML